jgi:spermidine synthase
MTMRRLAVLLSFSLGLLSLSQEIAWVRLVSFGHQGLPHAFAIVLVAFLLGIAAGALWGSRRCKDGRPLLPLVLRILVLAAVVDLSVPWQAPWLMAQDASTLTALMLVVGGCAMVKGTLFPIIHHLGAQECDEGIGRGVSRVYVANVLGSALGPVLTGFVLLDLLTVDQVFSVVSLGTAALAWVVWRYDNRRKDWWLPAVATSLGVLSLAWPAQSLETMAQMEGGTLSHMVQNKHGVVHVMAGAKGGDITFGGNIYDGRISLDMHSNLNRLDRAYLLATLHPRPARVLVIGLSTGAWTQALLGMPGVESVDVVELNPAYLELVRRYPDVAPVLADPRVRVHIDDGRRWLKRHASERYDLVVMNTTFHWRAYVSLLLSREYMELVRGRLAPGGIFAFNTTSSLDALMTAGQVFPDVVRHSNFAYASNRVMTKLPDARERLQACRLPGGPAFAPDLFQPGAIGEQLAHAPLERVDVYLARAKPPGAPAPQVITDLNLLTEYRHGRPPPVGGLRFLLPPTPLQR